MSVDAHCNVGCASVRIVLWNVYMVLARQLCQPSGRWSVLASLLHPVGASRDMDRDPGAPLPIRLQARSETT